MVLGLLIDVLCKRGMAFCWILVNDCGVGAAGDVWV